MQIGTYFGIHSIGPDVMGNANPIAQELAALFSEKAGYPLLPHEKWLDLQQTGTPAEWCDEKNIAYIEIETSKRWASDFTRAKQGITSCITQLASK